MTSPRKTIVIMDDSVVVLETLAAVLTDRGFDVRTAENLAQLEKHSASCRPDLYVLDVQMPEAFGDDVGQLLREVRQVGVPILLFSGMEEEVLARRTKEAGLTGYVQKDAGLAPLLARITELLQAPVAAVT